MASSVTNTALTNPSIFKGFIGLYLFICLNYAHCLMELFFLSYLLFYTSFLIFLASEKCHVLFLKLKLGSWIRYFSCAKESKHQFHCPFMPGSCFDFVTWQSRIGLIGKDFHIIWDQNRASLVTQRVRICLQSSSIPGSTRSPGKENGNPLQYSCLKNFMDRGVWWAAVHGVAKSQTWLKWLSKLAHTSRASLIRSL